MGKRPSLRELATKGNSLRLRELIASAYPAEMWVKKFRQLDPIDQFRLWASTEPKEIKGEGVNTLILRLEGLNKNPQEIEYSEELPAALPGPSYSELARVANKPFPSAYKRESSFKKNGEIQ